MRKFIKLPFFEKTFFPISNYTLFLVIVMLMLNIMKENSDNPRYKLALALCVVYWILSNIIWSFLSEGRKLRDEYREYLVKELENNVIAKSSEDEAFLERFFGCIINLHCN